MIGDTMNKTKIVATIGPASQDKQILKQMILAGLDVIRIILQQKTKWLRLRRVSRCLESIPINLHFLPLPDMLFRFTQQLAIFGSALLYFEYG